MKTFKKIFVWMMILSLPAAFSAAQARAEDPAIAGPSVPTGSESVVEAKVGEAFAITLESNSTTGYNWQFAKPLASKMVKLVHSHYIAPTTQLYGAGGRETWTFRALQAGETHIFLQYVRPWEKNVTPLKTEIIVVMIEE